jgi:hypothetical protein
LDGNLAPRARFEPAIRRGELTATQQLAPIHVAGSFAIHQRDAGWYGLGIEAFLSAVKNWGARYAELKWSSYHHSEELAYFDRLDEGGLMCLTSRQRLGEHVYLHSSHVEVFFSGIPVDMSAIRRLCELVQNRGAKLENVGRNPVETLRFHRGIPVEAVGTIVCESDGTQWVSGLVVKNPFLGKKQLPRENSSPGEPLNFLSNNEYLLCSMKQWHVLEDQRVKYEIRYAEACWIENIPVLHVACDWSRIILSSLRKDMEHLETVRPSFTTLTRRNRLAVGRKRGNRQRQRQGSPADSTTCDTPAARGCWKRARRSQ